ncbi:MAG: hypothetical protein ACREJ2_17910, partial [Planctomycetota bacterium]
VLVAAQQADEPDCTFAGYAYRAIGLGLMFGVALSIALGLATGSIWIGLDLCLALAGLAWLGGLLRAVGLIRPRATDPAGGASEPGAAGPAAPHEPTTPATVPPAPAAAATEPPGDSILAPLAGARRPVSRRDHLLLLALLAATFLFFLGAEFHTRRLFDPDGNDHAVCVRWLLDTGSLREPFPAHPVLHYIDAYPPAYDLIAAGLGKICGDRAALPLKLLTALLIALSVAWLFGLIVELTRRPALALWAAFFFVMAPNNLTAFIWAHALAFGLFPLLTALEIRLLRRFRASDFLGVGLVLGGICMTAASPGLKAIPWAGVPVLTALIGGRWRAAGRVFAAGCLAGLIALIWWGPMFAKYPSYHALWRAQLAPEIIPTADTHHWTAPPLIHSAGSGDSAINLGVNFLGWDHAGEGSESPTLPLSLGWAQTIFTLLGLSVAATEHLRRRGHGLRAAMGLPAADLLCFLLMLYAILGMLGPVTGLELYSYRFLLFLTVPCAYFAARGLNAVAAAPAPTAAAVFVLLAVAFVGSQFQYAWLAQSLGVAYWLRMTMLATLVGWPLLGFVLSRTSGTVAPSAPVATADSFAPPRRPGAVAAAACGALVLFSLYGGGLNRYYVSYCMPVTNTYTESVGRSSEDDMLDRLPDELPVGTMVYPADGRDLERFVVAHEMRAPIFMQLDDAALDRLLQTDPAAFVAALREYGVDCVFLGASYYTHLLDRSGNSLRLDQERVTAIEAALAAVPGVTQVAAEPSPHPPFAPTVLLRLGR